MTNEELEEKMDELGKLIHGMEKEQLLFDMKFRNVTERIAELKDELKQEFLARKKGLKSQCLEVRYRKGAVKWETKWLDGYSLDHPEIAKFRKVGEPTVAFVTRNEGWADDGR